MAILNPNQPLNKLLITCTAILITISTIVHISPSSTLIRRPHSSSLHDISFQNNTWHWNHAPPSIRKLGPMEASDLLKSKWMIIAGDSQARLIFISLQNLLPTDQKNNSSKNNNKNSKILLQKHSDYSLELQTTKIDFIWAPYATNITEMVKRFRRTEGGSPDAVVMGVGLWHMLHVTDSCEYGESLVGVRSVVEGWGVKKFWVAMPELEIEKLNTEEKREKMGEKVQRGYRREVYRRGFKEEEEEMMLLDLWELSRRCRCTDDGMHYDSVVYDALVQILLNALLLPSSI